MPQFIELHLTCADKTEADRIANILLEKRLVACIRQVPVTSDYHWQGKLEQAKEILLIMESREDLFDRIEAEVAKLHSYDTFVLTATPITRASHKALQWLKESFIDE